MQPADVSVYGHAPSKGKAVNALDPFLGVDCDNAESSDASSDRHAIVSDPIEPGCMLVLRAGSANQRAARDDGHGKVKLRRFGADTPDVKPIVRAQRRQLLPVRTECDRRDFRGFGL